MRMREGDLESRLPDAQVVRRRKTALTVLDAGNVWATVIAVLASDATKHPPEEGFLQKTSSPKRAPQDQRPSSTVESELPHRRPPPSEPITREMGERFVADRMSFEVIEAYFMPGGSLGVGRRALGGYLCVRTRVENVDVVPRDVPMAVLLDDAEAMHQASGEGVWSRAYFSSWEELNPGLHRTARYLFDVPTDREFRLVIPAKESGKIAAVVPLTITDFPVGK